MDSTFPEQYAKEQARVREVLEAYKALGPAGAYGYVIISITLDKANKAAAEHDTAGMVRAFEEMKGIQ